MICKEFGNLNDGQIKAVLQLTFQLIASANYGVFSEKDDPSIDVMMNALGFSGTLFSNLGNAFWNDAMNMSPFEAFRIVSMFDDCKKMLLKKQLLQWRIRIIPFLDMILLVKFLQRQTFPIKQQYLI